MLKRFGAALAVVLLLGLSCAWGADRAEDMKPIQQGAFAARLVDALGWTDGLPDKPTDKDYLAILHGSRHYRFEAEDYFDKIGDNVTVRKYDLYGPFSGTGWVNGISTPTSVHFKIFLPLAGTYTMSAAAKGDDILWSVAGRAFKVDFGNRFKTLTLGKVTLPAGVVEFNAVLPPEGGLDYIEFSAPDYVPVEPFAGWDFSDLMTQHQLAEVTASLLGLEKNLPDDQKAGVTTLQLASVIKLPVGTHTTRIEYLGKFFSPEWVRVGTSPITLEVPLDLAETTVYGIRVRFVGRELTAGFGARTVTLPGKPYLDWLDLGMFRLAKGQHTLYLNLPAGSGVDEIQIMPKRATPADYLTAVGMHGAPAQPILAGQVDDILISLVDRFTERR